MWWPWVCWKYNHFTVKHWVFVCFTSMFEHILTLCFERTHKFRCLTESRFGLLWVCMCVLSTTPPTLQNLLGIELLKYLGSKSSDTFPAVYLFRAMRLGSFSVGSCWTNSWASKKTVIRKKKANQLHYPIVFNSEECGSGGKCLFKDTFCIKTHVLAGSKHWLWLCQTGGAEVDCTGYCFS